MRIHEPTPFSGKWFGRNFRGAGLRYEIGVSIESGKMVSVNGPYACGENPDVSIFRHRMKKVLSNGEMVVADNGYTDERCLRACDIPNDYKKIHGKIRARHEIVNRRLKQFSILTTTFRNSLELHGCAFHAVANLIHVSMELEENVFEIEM